MTSLILVCVSLLVCAVVVVFVVVGFVLLWLVVLETHDSSSEHAMYVSRYMLMKYFDLIHARAIIIQYTIALLLYVEWFTNNTSIV